jgi:hypothetical protein
MNVDNFETILKEASDYHCIEAHILLYLGKKKEGIPIEKWKKTIYDNSQHSEATLSRLTLTTSSETYPEYIDRPYEEVYREIQKTFSKWDIYSINHMMLTILKELNQPSLEIYISKLTKILSSKTLELTNNTPSLETEPTESIESIEPIEPTEDIKKEHN